MSPRQQHRISLQVNGVPYGGPGRGTAGSVPVRYTSSIPSGMASTVQQRPGIGMVPAPPQYPGMRPGSGAGANTGQMNIMNSGANGRIVPVPVPVSQYSGLANQNRLLFPPAPASASASASRPMHSTRVQFQSANSQMIASYQQNPSVHPQLMQVRLIQEAV